MIDFSLFPDFADDLTRLFKRKIYFRELGFNYSTAKYQAIFWPSGYKMTKSIINSFKEKLENL